jgi:hypothetical protein
MDSLEVGLSLTPAVVAMLFQIIAHGIRLDFGLQKPLHFTVVLLQKIPFPSWIAESLEGYRYVNMDVKRRDGSSHHQCHFASM